MGCSERPVYSSWLYDSEGIRKEDDHDWEAIRPSVSRPVCLSSESVGCVVKIGTVAAESNFA
jgi:hypothetical protein